MVLVELLSKTYVIFTVFTLSQSLRFLPSRYPNYVLLSNLCRHSALQLIYLFSSHLLIHQYTVLCWKYLTSWNILMPEFNLIFFFRKSKTFFATTRVLRWIEKQSTLEFIMVVLQRSILILLGSSSVSSQTHSHDN